MEKKTDLFNELVDDLQIKTKEYLQVVTGWKFASLLCLLLLLTGSLSAQSNGPSKDGSRQGGFSFQT